MLRIKDANILFHYYISYLLEQRRRSFTEKDIPFTFFFIHLFITSVRFSFGKKKKQNYRLAEVYKNNATDNLKKKLPQFFMTFMYVSFKLRKYIFLRYICEEKKKQRNEKKMEIRSLHNGLFFNLRFFLLVIIYIFVEMLEEGTETGILKKKEKTFEEVGIKCILIYK